MATTITVLDSTKFYNSFIDGCQRGLIAASDICESYFIKKAYQQMSDTLCGVVMDNMESDHCTSFRLCSRMYSLCEKLEKAASNNEQISLLYLYKDVAATCWQICQQLSGIDNKFSGIPCNGDFGYLTIDD